MRAPFDRFIDVYFGRAEFPVLTPRALNVPARFVTDDAFIEGGEPFNDVVGYLTTDTLSFGPPALISTVGDVAYLDFGWADLIAIISGGPITHQVYRQEYRTWPTHADYSRGSIGPIRGALPTVCSAGYAEEYRYGISGPGTNILTRTSPTTWTDGTFTLTAEATGPPDSSCQSVWTFSNTTLTWSTTYNGYSDPALLTCPTPGAPNPVWIYAV